jgi:hypothetical protein
LRRLRRVANVGLSPSHAANVADTPSDGIGQ